MSYEIHITLPVKDAVVAENVAKDLHWKTSKIDGDPVLGKQVFFYLTTHAPSPTQAFYRMDSAVIALKAAGCTVIREKVELIIHDRRL